MFVCIDSVLSLKLIVFMSWQILRFKRYNNSQKKIYEIHIHFNNKNVDLYLKGDGCNIWNINR